jgi:Na+/H+ antiporter NhaD/arsenite permease-like protein
MEALTIGVFIIGYMAIAFEHPLGINKTASAILTGVLCWILYGFSGQGTEQVNHQLIEHFGSISEILFFLLGAMTIVELVDAHHGFAVITDRIRTKDARTLLWLISWVAFFLSSVLDNLTTTIVMVSLLRKLLPAGDQRKLFVGLVVIAANAGGAWTSIGDVTTTMLWIGGQISAVNIMKAVFLPSVVCLFVPLLYVSWKMGKVPLSEKATSKEDKPDGSKLMFFLGLGALIFVPIFKGITHLPPYLGMMFGLSILWIASELIHADKDEEERKPYTASNALNRIDTPSVLFFLGILLAIAALESFGTLTHVAQYLDKSVGNLDVITILIGVLSAVVDNVPLVAASMGMYDLSTYPMDHKLWEFMAFCAGTGGSMLIIGSAAGVAAMGMEKIDFMWYAKKISFVAALGYFAGCAVYLLQYSLLHT